MNVATARWKHRAGLLLLLASTPQSWPEPAMAGAQGARVETQVRAAFPNEARAVLDGPSPVIDTQGKFWSIASELHPALSIAFPSRPGEPMRLSTLSGFELEIWESGLRGRALRVGQSMSYEADYGRAFWRADPKGAEEWLHVLPGAQERGKPIASWTVAGGRPVRRADTVQIVDARGAPRLRVSCPRAVTKSGRQLWPTLSVDGDTILMDIEATAEEVLIDPLWSPVGSLPDDFTPQSATTLDDGRILLVGSSQAALYESDSDVFNLTGPMTIAHGVGSTATLLSNGNVLAVGGSGATTTAELFDPASGAWTATGSLASTRYAHAAARLDDGRVLVAGGLGPNVVCSGILPHQGYTERVNTGGNPTAEIYDPETGTWSYAAPPPGLHEGGVALKLRDGKVMLAAGSRDRSCNSSSLMLPREPAPDASLYDPSSNSWSPAAAPAPKYPMNGYAAASLPTGDALLVHSGGPPNAIEAEILSAGSGRWQSASYRHRSLGDSVIATALADGRVLVLGVKGGAAIVTVYNPAVDRWTDVPHPMDWETPLFAFGRQDGSAIVFVRGSAAGSGGPRPILEQLLDLRPSDTHPCDAGEPCFDGACVDGRSCDRACGDDECSACAVAAGAIADGVCSTLAEGFSCETGICQQGTCTRSDTWAPTRPMKRQRAGHRATVLLDGRVLVTGGVASPRLEEQAEIYDPRTRAWSATAPMVAAHSGGHTATRLADGRVLVVDETTEIYDPTQNSWTPAPRPESPTGTLNVLATTLLDDGRVFGAGGPSMVFDPGTNTWSPTAQSTYGRSSSTVILLQTGKVLVLGTSTGSTVQPPPELFDPVTDSWSTANAPAGLFECQPVGLADGKVLCFVGRGGLALYDPLLETWPDTLLPIDPAEIEVTNAALLTTGEVVAVGLGFQQLDDGSLLTVAAGTRFNPANRTWTQLAPMLGPRRAPFTLTALADGEVLAAGGYEYFLEWGPALISSVTAETWPPSSTATGSTGGATCAGPDAGVPVDEIEEEEDGETQEGADAESNAETGMETSTSEMTGAASVPNRGGHSEHEPDDTGSVQRSRRHSDCTIALQHDERSRRRMESFSVLLAAVMLGLRRRLRVARSESRQRLGQHLRTDGGDGVAARDGDAIAVGRHAAPGTRE